MWLVVRVLLDNLRSQQRLLQGGNSDDPLQTDDGGVPGQSVTFGTDVVTDEARTWWVRHNLSLPCPIPTGTLKGLATGYGSFGFFARVKWRC